MILRSGTYGLRISFVSGLHRGSSSAAARQTLQHDTVLLRVAQGLHLFGFGGVVGAPSKPNGVAALAVVFSLANERHLAA